MNKQEIINKIDELQEYMDQSSIVNDSALEELYRLKATIDAPEPKVGRVMSVNELANGELYYASCAGVVQAYNFNRDATDYGFVSNGQAFHDGESCNKNDEYLKLEQELRVAQIADGFTPNFGGYALGANSYRVSFRSEFARDSFYNSHTSDQIKLLIRGV